MVFIIFYDVQIETVAQSLLKQPKISHSTRSTHFASKSQRISVPQINIKIEAATPGNYIYLIREAVFLLHNLQDSLFHRPLPPAAVVKRVKTMRRVHSLLHQDVLPDLVLVFCSIHIKLPRDNRFIRR